MVDTTGEKRKRGRPRKNPNEIDAPIQAVKRGRGRPKKIHSEFSSTATNKSGQNPASKELNYKAINAWDNTKFSKRSIMSFCENYKAFMNKAKTEREFIKESVALARQNKFVNIDEIGDTNLKPGDRVYRVVKEKLMLLAVIGNKLPEEGTRIVGAHVDSPRIDIKQNPLYESTDMVFFKTHYYGGIKKYQWLAIPLALHGIVVKADGTSVEINIGEDEKDPVFTITDLLPHLAKDQLDKKVTEAFHGENMNVLLGSEPVSDKENKERFKSNILNLLYEKYGIIEEDLISSELRLFQHLRQEMLV
jgi:aspartyl aminopeptidase